MKIVKDGFQVRKIPKEEVNGAIAPIYLLGLPGDLDKLEKHIKLAEDHDINPKVDTNDV